MILIYGGVAVDPARVEEVTAAAVVFAAKCTAEEGAVTYTLSWDVERTNFIRLVENWTDVDTYTAHTKQQHTIDWTALMVSAAIEAPAFVKFDASPLPL